MRHLNPHELFLLVFSSFGLMNEQLLKEILQIPSDLEKRVK